ncbi:MAG: proprotein convertase P-domain-containing protein [Flavobacteriales bacterium]|nr:MAG: proprotein convertase P-domain-containing protein [Flavobacteriales bacterium]
MRRTLLQLSKAIVAVACFMSCAHSTDAQVTVTATGVGPGPTAYTTLNAAFAAINAGTHQGAITCAITGNTTEPAPPTPLLSSGTGSSNYISILIAPTGGNWTINSAVAPTASRGVIEIQGADNVTIDGDDPGTSGTRNLTFQAAAVTTTGVAVVRFASTSTTNGATFCTIKNCVVIGSRASATSTVTNYGIYSGTAVAGNTSTSGQSDNNDNLTIENNEVRRCYWGVYVAGTSANKCDNAIIRNNVIGNATAADAVANRGIYVQNTQTTAGAGSAIIELNDVRLTSAPGTTDIAAIEVANGNAGALVRRNRLHDVQNLNTGGQGSYGLWISGSTENAGIEVSNNFIWDCYNDNWTTTYSATSPDLPVGIRVSAGATGLKVYHNSISLNQPNTDPTVINFSVCLQFTVNTITGSDVRNNIFSNTQTGISTSGNYCMTVPSGFTFGTINGNNYYENQAYSYVGWNGTNRATLTEWQGQTLQDAGSKAVNPAFTSTTDLHIPTATPSELESAGAAGTGITVDVDNDARPGPTGSVNGGATANDIGADEFDGAPVDLTAPTITYPALGNTCTFGARTLTASITDASGVPTTGAGLPVLYWRINAGAYTAATATHAGANNYDFSFGAGVVAGDVVSYYIVAQDNASTPNVSVSPSSGSSGYSANPPAASTPPTAPNSYLIGVTLSGTYTVGVGGNYTTLTAAVAAYNANCLGGPVVFELTDATYNSETHPININANPDASSTNTLTIRPASGASPSFSNGVAGALIVLNGADHVTIDGSNNPQTNSCCPLVQSSRNLFFGNTSTATTSAVIWLSSGATNNTIRNCTIRGGGTGMFCGVGSGGASISTTSLGLDNDNNTIENNDIGQCSVGIYSQGASSANKNSGTVIRLNKMDNVAPSNLGTIGILTGFEDNIMISCNSISEVNGSSDRAAISAGFGTSYSTSTTVGNEVTNATISNNKVGNVIGSNFNTYLGIALGSATSGTSTISNNMVVGVVGPATSPDYCAGIVAGCGTGSTTNILHNTVHMQGTMSTGGGAFSMVSAGLALPNTSLGTLTVRNNIFSNTQLGNAGATGRFVAVTMAASSFTGFTSSNNDLYAVNTPVGTSSYHVGITGGMTGTSRTTLLDWQTATGQDAGSVNVAPVFTSSTDLHLVTTDASNISNLMSGGTTTSVTTDIDCATRNTLTPTIGADEFSVAACTGLPNAGTSSPANTSVCSGATVNMTNNAINLTTGISYQWQVASVSGGPYADVSGGTGATTQSYTTGALAQGSYFYVLRVRCANETVPNGDSYSNEVAVTVGAAAPTATASAVLDCSVGGFYIRVDLTSLGGATDVDLVPSMGPGLQFIDAPGVYDLGPFTSGSNVNVDVVNNTDPFCSLNLGSFTATTNCINNGDCLASGTQNIPDNGCGTNTSLDVHLPISGLNDDLGSNVVLGSVALEVEHTWRGDLRIVLVSPTGQARNLFLQKPTTSAGGNNLGDLSLPCPSAPLVLQDGGAALATLNSGTDNAAFGTFAPEETLAGYTGNPNGTWTLRVCDAANLDNGSLRHVQLNFLNMDCLGVFGGTTLPGSPCDDGNIETQNDAYDTGCLCVGDYEDCLGNPGGPALPGTTCDDGLVTTGNDLYDASCNCTGQLIDCEGTPGGTALPGSPCDDGSAGTINDLWDGSCNCVGIPFGCQDNEVNLELGTDANGAQTSWEIVPSGGGAAVCSGGGYADNSTITETCCLPTGCYRLIVYDSFGDGMTTGGYRLTDENGSRIIDNWGDGMFASTSTIANNGSFCVPIGTDAMQASSCDRLDLLPSSVVAAVPNPAVSSQYGIGSNTDDGYQFWIYNPDGGYSRLIYKSLANPGQPGAPFGPTAPAYLQLSSIVTSPVPTNVKLNIRVRSRVNGVNTEFGPACVMMIDVLTQCPTTQLVDNVNSTQHSCGVTGKTVGASGNAGKIYCNVVSGANKYQWRFENAANGYVRQIATTTSVLPLNKWSTSPLLCGTHTYDVTVRASFDNGTSYCPVGTMCTVGITNNNTTPFCTTPSGPFAGGGLHAMEETTNGMQLWPNPVLDGSVDIELDGIASEVHDVRIVVLDLYGKVVLDRVVLTEGANELRTSLQLGSDVASGVYVVNVTAGEQTFNQRLVVE